LHDGGTDGFSSIVGLQLDKHIGLIVLTNQSNVLFPDAIGVSIFDQLLGNSPVYNVAELLKVATKQYSDEDKKFAAMAVRLNPAKPYFAGRHPRAKWVPF
jgi:hypothetical protein